MSNMANPPMNLRGVHLRRSKVVLMWTAVASFATYGAIMFYRHQKAKHFENFYKTFDHEKVGAAMTKEGVFKGMNPDGTLNEEVYD